jgi:hypothetical protein
VNYSPNQRLSEVEEDRRVDGRTAHIRDRKRSVERDGIMAPSKLGRKIFSHLLDAC